MYDGRLLVQHRHSKDVFSLTPVELKDRIINTSCLLPNLVECNDTTSLKIDHFFVCCLIQLLGLPACIDFTTFYIISWEWKSLSVTTISGNELAVSFEVRLQGSDSFSWFCNKFSIGWFSNEPNLCIKDFNLYSLVEKEIEQIANGC